MMDQSQGGKQQERAHECAVERLYGRSRRARENFEDLGGALRDTAAELRRTLQEQFEHHPYATFGAGFAAGYILGGGLPSRFTRLIFDFGTRIAVARLAQQFAREAFAGNGHGATMGSAQH